MFRAYRSLALLALVGLAAVPVWSGTVKSSAPGDEFHERLREIALGYAAWGRVDDQARWAPALCERPSAPGVYFSKSKDEDTHGRKLYSLFASQRKAYRTGDDQPVGQVLVKQSWVPEEIRADDPRRNEEGACTKEADNFVRTVAKDGKLYLATKQADLFIMFKTDPKTPNTDEGWVYGTVTPDGKTVTSAGRVASCMACHQEAKADRLFGIKSKSE
jgi:hypothetical protein